ncbi:MAG: hypothetical protein Q8P07_01035 [bacterium]|nr:hypothetical protein [bacterium]
MKTKKAEIRAYVLDEALKLSGKKKIAETQVRKAMNRKGMPIEARLKNAGFSASDRKLIFQNIFEWLNKREPVEYVSGEKLRTLL